MTVAFEVGRVVLRDNCPIEDAEPLLILLQDNPEALVDISDATNVHAAVLQVLLAYKRNLTGGAHDPFLREWVVPVLANDDKTLI